jgi:hypothetical protein
LMDSKNNQFTWLLLLLLKKSAKGGLATAR